MHSFTLLVSVISKRAYGMEIPREEIPIVYSNSWIRKYKFDFNESILKKEYLYYSNNDISFSLYCLR